MNRLDLELVRQGLAKSRTAAAELIRRGNVLVNGVVAHKPNTTVAPEHVVTVSSPLPYVSRSGEKLQAALDHWNISAVGKTVADIGSSTGGFTDCMLKRGAAHVYAIDVGTNQLDAALRTDPRVTVLEETDVRTAKLPSLADIAVIDVSFVSLEKILPAAVGLLAPKSKLVALMKPQFEVGKAHIGKGGIVRDTQAHHEALARNTHALESLGFRIIGTIPSPVIGKDGNQEYLIYAARG